jgi:hypothetical protein
MRRILSDPPLEPLRSYCSQMCVLLTGIAAGVVPPAERDALHSVAHHMGRRDGYHVVLAFLATPASMRQAADRAMAFGDGVAERASQHPYGPEWSGGFAQATRDAAADIMMYAATGTLPRVDAARLRAARMAARHLTPLGKWWAARTIDSDPPRSHREW